jgi:hypothetical protein
VQFRLIEGIRSVSPEAWDALAGADDPFVEHAFLRTLEDSGSVGADSGWDPIHVTVWEGDRLVGALPLYLKEHSFGEFIFDWAWADAAARLGLEYYPKLVSMVPVTPVTGRRLLVAENVDRKRVADTVVQGCFEAAERTGASSLHLLFLTDDEKDELAGDSLLPRLSFQFHWHNDGYASFDDFLGQFRSQMRKQVRKERRRVAESGLDVRVLEGSELSDGDWEAVRTFYRINCARHGSFPYLTPEFFEIARERLAHRIVVVMAYDAGQPVAASLNFEKGSHLYGRYWGCREDHEFLHFELCYYRLIERAIHHGMTRFEAGAQGIHKLRRGLMPSAVHSAHWIRHPLLSQAVGEFLPREAHAVRERMQEFAHHGPFRRDE